MRIEFNINFEINSFSIIKWVPMNLFLLKSKMLGQHFDSLFRPYPMIFLFLSVSFLKKKELP